MKAAGARQRHIERCKYIPHPKAARKVRFFNGAFQTFKRRGDIIIVNARVKSYVVQKSGWQ